MVEDQLSANSPIETALFCETVEDRGFSRHEEQEKEEQEKVDKRGVQPLH